MKRLKRLSSKRSSSTPQSSASSIIEGNGDLLIEILVFLPAKSLHRFKSVNKRWRSLISDPSFCRRHTLYRPHRHRETQPLLIYGGCGSKYRVCNPRIPKTFSFEIQSEFPLVKILQSCNGLLLLRCSKTKRGRSRYYVFNPTTMQQRELSPLPIRNTIAAIYLMFDPSLSPNYRVVCFLSSTHRSTLIYLYDSETHKWKQIGDKSHKSGVCFRNGIYFNGGIYFVRFGSSNSYCFDPNDNVLISDIPSPIWYRVERGQRHKNYVMESNEVLLCLTLFSWEEGYNGLNVYVMKKKKKGSKNNEWKETYWANMNPVLGKRVSCVDAMHLLCMIMGERGQDRMVLFRLDSKIMIYKFYDDAFEVVDQEFLKDHPEWYVDQAAHQFIHTLAPL